MNYLTSGEICSKLRISKNTLMKWKNEGKLVFLKLSSKKYLYDIDSIIKQDLDARINVVYARVSNTKQADDLKTQVQIIANFMVSNGIIVDKVFEEVASGMNEHRNKLNELIQLVVEKKVGKVYISYKDRLTRFGFDYFRNWFSLFGTEIVILNSTKEEDFQTELAADLVSVIHHFSMKMYSNRRKELKLAMKKLQEIDDSHK